MEQVLTKKKSLRKPSPRPSDSLDSLSKYDLVLGIRRLKEGNFIGLWELTRIDPQTGEPHIVTDANSKQILLNMARNEMLRCG